ncbi:hypothetical protein TSUD_395650 [Trifolium subterraneum]|uniref:DUF4218 domain-containing protein n=1 Tax=Trifolium subterraneum TaxID=3900 RepID=A0A2Z6N2E2_TRISU|nr:hypothetical protein TSUD_395650 [Trifolium subterraneum]
MGMEYEKIHACPNDCILYRNEYQGLKNCPTCGQSRFKVKDGDVREYDGQLRHPADSLQWKKVDDLYPDFGNEARNFRLGLATDGMNPYGNLSSNHSSWPVLLIIYNLSPSICMKRKYIMLSMMISGPRQLGNDIDVYLSPLIEDLRMLWEEGVDVLDAYSNENFKMRAIKVIDPKKLDELENEAVVILCQLEMYFPPSFFDIMVHLIVHLVREIRLCGPVYLRWMYPVERYMKILKGYMKNQNRPEASIVEKYIAEEAIEFCSDYMSEANAIGIPKSRHGGRCGVPSEIKRTLISSLSIFFFFFVAASFTLDLLLCRCFVFGTGAGTGAIRVFGCDFVIAAILFTVILSVEADLRNIKKNYDMWKATGGDYSVESAESIRPLCTLIDVGLVKTTTENRVFGALKGALDGGLDGV